MYTTQKGSLKENKWKEHYKVKLSMKICGSSDDKKDWNELLTSKNSVLVHPPIHVDGYSFRFGEANTTCWLKCPVRHVHVHIKSSIAYQSELGMQKYM